MLLRTPSCSAAVRLASRSLPTQARLPSVVASQPCRWTAGRAAAAMASSAEQEALDRFKPFIPALTGNNYKGQHGKIGIVGGCREYTGAPYFAAMSASKVGADLPYVFCTESASIVIKTYSPELIVMPLLPELPLFDDMPQRQQEQRVTKASDLLLPWVQKLTCLVVGPGLGDDHTATATAENAIRQVGIPLVIDGSGINIIVRKPELVRGYTRCILTPNIAELGRIAGAAGVPLDGGIGVLWQQHTQAIAAALQGPILISKGPADVITDGEAINLACNVPATPKRSGGQGDVLAGVAATFFSWVVGRGRSDIPAEEIASAAYAACALVRTASSQAFTATDRAMVAGDVISELPSAFRHTLLDR